MSQVYAFMVCLIITCTFFNCIVLFAVLKMFTEFAKQRMQENRTVRPSHDR